MSSEAGGADNPQIEISEIDEFFDAGLSYMASGDAVRAVSIFERVLAAKPDHIEATHGLIRALVDAGRVDDGLELAMQLIEREPEDVLAVSRLSMIYQQKGMIAEAEATAAKAKVLGWKMELRGAPVSNTEL